MKQWRLLLIPLMIATAAGCGDSGTGNTDVESGSANPTGNGGTFTVSGSVTRSVSNGAGLSGATVVLTAYDDSTAVTDLHVTTGTAGTYSFQKIARGVYLASVSRTGYAFVPETAIVTVNDRDVTVETFIGVAISTGGNAGSSAFYPLRANATWIFASHTDAEGLSYDETVTNRVLGTVVLGGTAYWNIISTIRDSNGVEYTKNTINLRIANAVMHAYGVGFIAAKPLFADAASARPGTVRAALRTTASEYPLFTFGAFPGTTWNIYQYSGSSGGTVTRITVTGKYAGPEAAGPYSDCARYEITNEGDYTSVDGSGAYRRLSTYWLAPDIGPVRIVEEYFAGETLFSLTRAFTTTDSLTAYTRP